MPTSPPTRCTEPDCIELTANTKCAKHTRRNRAHEQRTRHRANNAWGDGTTGRWRRIRAVQLAHNPTCAHCDAPAAEVDHVIPRAIGGAMYNPTNHQSLCKRCHQRKTAREMGLTQAGRNHTPRTYRVDNRVIVVSGSPCSGKTTYVAQRKQPDDIVFDFDALALAIGAPGDHAQPAHFVPFVCEMRDAFLARLTRKHHAPRVWIITCDPHLADQLVGAQHVQINATRDECMSRAVTAKRPHRWTDLIDAWHQQHGPHTHSNDGNGNTTGNRTVGT